MWVSVEREVGEPRSCRRRPAFGEVRADRRRTLASAENRRVDLEVVDAGVVHRALPPDDGLGNAAIGRGGCVSPRRLASRRSSRRALRRASARTARPGGSPRLVAARCPADSAVGSSSVTRRRRGSSRRRRTSPGSPSRSTSCRRAGHRSGSRRGPVPRRSIEPLHSHVPLACQQARQEVVEHAQGHAPEDMALDVDPVDVERLGEAERCEGQRAA